MGDPKAFFGAGQLTDWAEALEEVFIAIADLDAGVEVFRHSEEDS